MAVTKAKKIEQVEALSKEFQGAKHGIVGTFAKMTVEKDFELRKTVRGAGGRYRVLKNTLAERAAQGTAVEEAVKSLTGVTSIAYTSGDPVALAKALSKYAMTTRSTPSRQASSKAASSRSRTSTRWPVCRRRKRFTPSCSS